MVDMHVHLERGPYTREWLNEFVKVAVEQGITYLCLLEHSHRFIDFKHIYNSLGNDPECGSYQIFKKYEVDMVTASDAHKPEDVGKSIYDATQFINRE